MKAIQYFKTELFFNKALLKADYFKFGSIAFEQQLISLEFFQTGAQAGCYLHRNTPRCWN